jgi:methionyl-tRNA synthetase
VPENTKTTQQYDLTTAIPYINAKPHIGHVLEWFQADTIARYQTLLGKEVSFTAGSDENSLKNVQAAEKAEVLTQKWLDQYAKIFEDAFQFFNISLTGFRRSSDQKLHWPGVQKLWSLCDANDDLYKKTYTGLYCVGCEAFYAPDELIDGKCPEHLTVPEQVQEENYFFRLSKYQDQIFRLIESDELCIVSEQYKNEMLGFVRKGLEDFSVSRTAARARGVGVPVPHDPTQTMYVWFDALAVYLTAIGWGYDEKLFNHFWPADVHFIGKGINRFHSVYWIGMLLSAKLALPKVIAVHGYLTANGQKMSKSLGNVVDPFEFVKQYGLEPTRFYLLKEIPTHSDGDFSETHFQEVYTADLANGLGNLCSRVAKLCEKAGVGVNSGEKTTAPVFASDYTKAMDDFALDKALQWVVKQIAETDEYLSQQQPWKQTGDDQLKTLAYAVQQIIMIAKHLQPFLPDTAAKILEHFQQPQIKALAPLFMRLPV